MLRIQEHLYSKFLLEKYNNSIFDVSGITKHCDVSAAFRTHKHSEGLHSENKLVIMASNMTFELFIMQVLTAVTK